MNSGKLSLDVDFNASVGKTGELANLNDSIAQAVLLGLTFNATASAAGQFNTIWHDRRLLAGAASENIDFASTLTDVFGDSADLALIRAIIIINRSDLVTTAHATATDATMTIGNLANSILLFDSALDSLTLAAGDFLAVTRNTAAGITVTASTADLLKILNNDGSDQLQYDIIVAGKAL